MSLIEQFDYPIDISLGGSGDALASHIIRHMIQNYCPKFGQSFEIATNGLLIKKIIPNSPIRDYISNFSISVDAASAEIYEQVRRPGKWKVLLENLKWLSINRGSSHVYLSFTVQKTNFRDIPAFVELCKQLKFHGSIQALNDWGTWNYAPVKNPDAYTIINGTYLDHDVANPTHPDHLEFLKVIRSIYNENTNLNISPYFDKFK
jgi:MoaA/NifB/PqqE/SkfB family radical SAM enzyme